jgi:hypothetical protein
VCRKGGFGGRGNRGKGHLVVNRDIGEHLAVHVDVRKFQAVNQPAVG